MKRLALAVLCSAILILLAVPASATNGVAQVTFTKEPPAECKNMGRQVFEDPVWITVYVDGRCIVSVDPFWVDGGRD